MFVSRLDNSAGFFSVFFFTMNHYIYCRKNNYNFIIDSSKWLFLSNLGWEDYFSNIDIIDNIIIPNVKNVGFFDILEDYSIYEYKKYLWDIYKYNSKTIDKINETKLKYNIIDNNYGSIFIRRGDKL